MIGGCRAPSGKDRDVLSKVLSQAGQFLIHAGVIGWIGNAQRDRSSPGLMRCSRDLFSWQVRPQVKDPPSRRCSRHGNHKSAQLMQLPGRCSNYQVYPRILA